MCNSYPTQNRLKELVHYDPETGVFTWRRRDIGTFRPGKWQKKNRSIWNTRRAGKRAGTFNGRYWITSIDEHLCLLHRLAFIYMTGSVPEEVDHIDQDGANNQWENLRDTDRRTNQSNILKTTRNKSGVVGVSWASKRNKWTAHLYNQNLGRFENFIDAVHARHNAEKETGYAKVNPNSTAYQYLQNVGA